MEYKHGRFKIIKNLPLFIVCSELYSMSSNDEPVTQLKIKRINKKKQIHTLLIFNRSGICLYSRNFSKIYDMQDALISSFFSALMSFTKEVVGNKVNTIEMDVVKFVIFKKNGFYYGFLVDSVENISLVEQISEKVNLEYKKYIKENKINTDVEFIYDPEFDFIIDKILDDVLSSVFDLHKEEQIIEYLNDLNRNDEIEGVILLTDKGKVIHSSLDNMKLRYFLKEVDFRVKLCNNSILKLFYTSKNKELIFSEYVGDLYFIILIFNINIKFGVAEFYLQKVIRFINERLKN